MFRSSLLLAFLVSVNLQLFGQVIGEPDSSRTSIDTIQRIPWGNEAILSLSYANGGIGLGLIYKRQVAEKRYFRISLADIEFFRNKNIPYYSSQFPYSHLTFKANLTLGVEWRFKLHKKVTSYTGVDILCGASLYSNQTHDPSLPANRQISKDYAISAGLAFNSGVIVEVHEQIRLGLNLSPDVFYTFRPWERDYGNGQINKGKSHSVSTSFSSSSVQLQVIFHWDRKPYRLKKS